MSGDESNVEPDEYRRTRGTQGNGVRLLRRVPSTMYVISAWSEE